MNGARDFIGLVEIDDAAEAVAVHATAVVSRRRDRGLPTCGDNCPEYRKLTALIEEVGEVAQALQDGMTRAALRDELLDVATAATLWAWSIASEIDTATAGALDEQQGTPDV